MSISVTKAPEVVTFATALGWHEGMSSSRRALKLSEEARAMWRRVEILDLGEHAV